MRIYLALILTILTAFSTSAASIEFWHSMTGAKGQLLAQIVSDFNKQNPGSQVRMQFIGSYEEGLNKLRTALIAHRGPHVIQVTDIAMQVMIDSEATIPLQDFIDEDSTFPFKIILPAFRNYYSSRGRLQALPFATSNPILYYDKDAFTAAGVIHPPKTYAELIETAKKLTDPKKKTKGITWPLHSWFLEEFLARENVLLLDAGNGREGAPTHANYVNDASIAFLTVWKKMITDGTFANVGRGWDPAQQNFLAGRVKMLITSSSDIFELLKQSPFTLATAPIPSAGVSAIGGTVVGGNALWILKDKPIEERKLAYAFTRFMASAPVQELWHTNTGYFPIRADVIDTLKAKGFYEKYPVAWNAIEQLRASADTPATRGAVTSVFPEAREHMMVAIEEALNGTFSIQEALTRANRKTDFSLSRVQRWSRPKAP